MRPLVLSFLFMTVAASAAMAQAPMTRFLVPFVDAPAVPGAFGSRWEATTVVRNVSATALDITPTPVCFITCGNVGRLTAQTTSPTWFMAQFLGESPAALVAVESSRAADVVFASRIRDVSRSASSAGTEIPVVREDRFYATTLTLLDIAVEAPFRTTLRIYALPEVRDPQIEVRYFAENADTPVHIERLQLRTDLSSIAPGYNPLVPSAATRSGVDAVLAGTATHARIEIEPLTPGLRFWAFLTITNNETQQVTTVTPQPR